MDRRNFLAASRCVPAGLITPGLATLQTISPGGSGAEVPELLVVSYNIMAGRFHQTTGETTGFTANLKAIAAVLRDSGADLVLLQEVDVEVERSERTNQAQFLAQELDFQVQFAPAIEFQGGQFGLALLSRQPVLEHRVVPLFVPDYRTTHPHWGLDSEDFSEQRVVQVARIDFAGRPVSVVNTHLGLSQHQRRIQLAQIAAVLEELLLLPDRAVIFGGDLNCEPDAPELLPVRQRLRDCYQQIPDSRGIPLDIPIRDRLTFRSDRPSTCIDYLFVGGGKLEPAGTQVLSSTASDHRPVVARVRVR